MAVADPLVECVGRFYFGLLTFFPLVGVPMCVFG